MSNKKSVKKKALLLSEKPMKEQISYFTTLLESVEDKVKLIAEGHEALNAKMDGLIMKVDHLLEKIDRLADKVEYHDQEIRRIKTATSLN